MERRQAIRIKDAIKHEDGVVVVFDNGRSVFYSASVLYHSIPMGKELSLNPVAGEALTASPVIAPR